MAETKLDDGGGGDDDSLQQLVHSDLPKTEPGQEEANSDDITSDQLPEWLVGVIVVIVLLVIVLFTVIIISFIKNRNKSRSSMFVSPTACDDLESGKVGHSNDTTMTMTSFSTVPDTTNNSLILPQSTALVAHDSDDSISTRGSLGIHGIIGCRNPLFVDDEPGSDDDTNDNIVYETRTGNDVHTQSIRSNDINNSSTDISYQLNDNNDNDISKGVQFKYKPTSSGDISTSSTKTEEEHEENDQLSENDENIKQRTLTPTLEARHKRDSFVAVDSNLDVASSPNEKGDNLNECKQHTINSTDVGTINKDESAIYFKEQISYDGSADSETVLEPVDFSLKLDARWDSKLDDTFNNIITKSVESASDMNVGSMICGDADVMLSKTATNMDDRTAVSLIRNVLSHDVNCDVAAKPIATSINPQHQILSCGAETQEQVESDVLFEKNSLVHEYPALADTPAEVLNESSLAYEHTASSDTPPEDLHEKNSLVHEYPALADTPAEVLNESSLAYEHPASSDTPPEDLHERNSLAYEHPASSDTPTEDLHERKSLAYEHPTLADTPAEVLNERNSLAYEHPSSSDTSTEDLHERNSLAYEHPTLPEELHERNSLVSEYPSSVNTPEENFSKKNNLANEQPLSSPSEEAIQHKNNLPEYTEKTKSPLRKLDVSITTLTEIPEEEDEFIINESQSQNIISGAEDNNNSISHIANSDGFIDYSSSTTFTMPSDDASSSRHFSKDKADLFSINL